MVTKDVKIKKCKDHFPFFDQLESAKKTKIIVDTFEKVQAYDSALFTNNHNGFFEDSKPFEKMQSPERQFKFGMVLTESQAFHPREWVEKKKQEFEAQLLKNAKTFFREAGSFSVQNPQNIINHTLHCRLVEEIEQSKLKSEIESINSDVFKRTKNSKPSNSSINNSNVKCSSQKSSVTSTCSLVEKSKGN